MTILHKEQLFIEFCHKQLNLRAYDDKVWFIFWDDKAIWVIQKHFKLKMTHVRFQSISSSIIMSAKVNFHSSKLFQEPTLVTTPTFIQLLIQIIFR
jgi:hypothetical protein